MTPEHPVHDSPEQPNQFAPLLAAIRFGTAGLAAVSIVSVIVWSLVSGMDGLWGALIGAAVGGAFILATVLIMYGTRNVAPTTTGAILLGSWLLKIIIAIVVMVVLRGMDFYDRAALVVTIIAALVVMLGAETIAIARTRTPYVTPDSAVTDPGRESRGPGGATQE